MIVIVRWLVHGGAIGSILETRNVDSIVYRPAEGAGYCVGRRLRLGGKQMLATGDYSLDSELEPSLPSPSPVQLTISSSVFS